MAGSLDWPCMLFSITIGADCLYRLGGCSVCCNEPDEVKDGQRFLSISQNFDADDAPIS